jgi:hypothetical protein
VDGDQLTLDDALADDQDETESWEDWWARLPKIPPDSEHQAEAA